MEFVLVHGANHGSWCWNLLTPELEARGHRTLTVDLPIGDPEAGAEIYAETVVSAISGLEAPIVVGHSMAGLVIPLVAASRPVKLMVFLAALLPEPGLSLADQRAKEPIVLETAPQDAEVTHIGNGLYVVNAEGATHWYFHDVPTDIRSCAIEQLRPQSYVFMNETTPLTQWPETPSAYILCREDQTINPEWSRSASQERLGIKAHEIDGSHSPFLTRPSELADLLHDIAS